MRCVLVLLVSLLPSMATAEVAPAVAIRASFTRLRTAALAHDGAAAAREADDNTVRRYDELRSAALSAPDLHNLPLLDQIAILGFRESLSPDQLSAMDGRGLLAYAIGKEWVRPIPKLGSFLHAKVSGDQAEVLVSVKGAPDPTPIFYRRGKQGWRLDLSAQDRVLGAGLEIMRSAGETDAALVKRLVEQATGRPLTEAAWRPLIPSPSR